MEGSWACDIARGFSSPARVGNEKAAVELAEALLDLALGLLVNVLLCTPMSRAKMSVPPAPRRAAARVKQPAYFKSRVGVD